MPAIASAILILASVAVAGLILGSVKVRGIGLGPAGVLFAGILFGHLGASIDEDIAEYAREFGLVLFVFTIGLQLGPGIIQLWKQQGLLLNSMAFAVVVLGLLLVFLLQALFGFSVFATAGLFSGATTNTPSLGAAEQAAMTLPQTPDGKVGTLASAYAVAYPGGIIGIIASMLILRSVFRIDVDAEAKKAKNGDKHEPIEHRSILVDNEYLSGTAFGEIPGLEETGIRVSRIRRAGDTDVHVATIETVLREGDVILVVGTRTGLDRFEPLIGRRVDIDLKRSSGDVETRKVVVTEPAVLNQPLRDLSLDHLYNVTVTRIVRSGVEMTARGSSRFSYGDIARIVGEKDSLDRVTKVLGNSVKALRNTHFAPLFLGIAVGVILGMVPIHLPGIPFPVRLGLAGGPLIAAIVFSLVGRVGRFVWYIPYSANLALRELGIISFLACAGLGAGETFFEVALTSQGILWIMSGLVVTMVPLLTVGIIARLLAKVNYLTICGVIAGSMTDPPALAFANSLSDSEAPSTAYAAVYPLTMILRIIAAQAIVYALA